jgi:uncharacterized protein (TIGR03118 family)
VAAGVGALLPREAAAFEVRRLVTDPTGPPAPTRDAEFVNGWGLAASPTGPWWTTAEARDTSPLYAGNGRKQALTVRVPGGPTGIVYNHGQGFPVSAGGVTAPAKFLYACEDGRIRAWAPSVPTGWSTSSHVVVDASGDAVVFRGIAIATRPDGSQRVLATDFHNKSVYVFDEKWRRIQKPGAFVDPDMPPWYAPAGIQAYDNRVFVSYSRPAGANGNDDPNGGYVNEFDSDGNLVARVGGLEHLNQPWGMALAPEEFGDLGGHLLVANFGTGHITAYAPDGKGWKLRGPLEGRNGKPLVASGVWGIAFGNGDMAGPKDTLFFAGGPHEWIDVTQQSVEGLFGAITQAR